MENNYRNHRKNVKQKINNLFTLPFWNKVRDNNNIIQYNSEIIPILEDITPFDILFLAKYNRDLIWF